MGGLALGPLLAGFTAEYAPDPLRLVFGIYLALLIPGLVAVLLARETVPPDRRVAWRPGRIALPRDRSAFALAAATAFCAFTLLGLYSSLVPSFLRSGLHERNHAVAGLIVLQTPSGALARYDLLGYVVVAAMLVVVFMLRPIDRMVRAGR